MDLVQSVRKEGSRGGRAEFKWEDVKSSTHRENYLGHSLMAPVGRWQKNKDLSWYAKADGTEMSEAEARREEMKQVKQAEDEAMAKALGIEVPGANANMTAIGERPAQDSKPEARAIESSNDRRRRSDAGDDRDRRRRRDRSGGRDDRRHRRHHSRERQHRHRSRSRSRSRTPPRRDRRRSRSRDRYKDERPRHDERKERDRYRDDPPRRDDRDDRRRYSDRDHRRSRSPNGRY